MFALDNISTTIDFNAHVDDEQALAEGNEAADRIISGATMIDHLKVARALMVGSRIAAEQAGVASGKPYNIAFHKWLEKHPKLAAVNAPNRAAALWCLDPANWPRVEKFLATLDVDERQTILLRTVRRRLEVPTPRPASSTPREAWAPREATQSDPAAADSKREKPDAAAIAAAVEKALDKLRREHTREIEALNKAHEGAIWEERRRTLQNRAEGFAHGQKVGKEQGAQENERLKRALHEKVVEKLAAKLAANGQTQPTENDVALAALGQGPKQGRIKTAAFSEKEIALLRKALHPDGKPPELQKMFNAASSLFNDRAPLLIKSAKRHP